MSTISAKIIHERLKINVPKFYDHFHICLIIMIMLIITITTEVKLTAMIVTKLITIKSRNVYRQRNGNPYITTANKMKLRSSIGKERRNRRADIVSGRHDA